jgi:transcription-repair coupling factor (superfamily II helicase)
MEGKQVALLAPTTVLVQQHFNTFRERFSNFPVEIGMMSRFRTAKENQLVTRRLKDKQVDIVIGTHRLLNREIAFSDLGLLIIDEEQRFGVAQKEKIKQLKANVDVLMLSATPIPRTLHMALVGIRDMSIIETPPENRFPVQSYVVEWDDVLIREAIHRELSREGQVFLVHNRISDLDYFAEKVSKLVPEARIVVGHGQMPQGRLEQVMLDFIEGEYDVLISTTIIESGLDMPNVNTLIVHEADRYGLSQLHQLRGRVGRSSRRAYAYFTFQRNRSLTEIAEKRLTAIKEFCELAS